MHCFDFLSNSPRIFIFDRETNKTNFGGVLFLIYIIIMVLISLAYILDYALNDKYTFDGTKNYNTGNQDEIKKLNDNEELNPYIELLVAYKTVSRWKNKISIYDLNQKKFLETTTIDEYGWPGFKYKEKASNINLILNFFCGEDDDCNGYDLDTFSSIMIGIINVTYPGYKIEHSNDPPINEDKPISLEERFSVEDDVEYTYSYNWEVVKYKEEKSLFDTFTNRKIEYNFGHIKNDKPDIKSDSTDVFSYKENGYFVPLVRIQFKNEHDEYLLYKRKKISPLDVVAKIGSLFSTIKTFFDVFFSFYSKNFNNYKIVGKLLNNPKEPIKRIELTTKFKENISSKENEEEEEKDKINDIKNEEPLIDKNSNDFKIITKDPDINKDIDDNNDGNSSSFILNKLPFYDYFYNNIYSSCCRKRKNQEVINTVNDIMYHYLSVDFLLRNQILLENLLKDYKWNNPLLSNIQNNQMIIKLKNN